MSHARKEHQISIGTVTALSDEVRYYVWPSDVLRSKLEADQALGLQTTIAFSLSLVKKLRDGKDYPTYDEILAVAIADGRVPPEEKRALRDYRTRHGISQEDHLNALKKTGWSVEEWEDGALISRKLAPSRFLRKFKDLFT